MGNRVHIRIWGSLLVGSLVATPVAAGPLDPALSRLVVDRRCHVGPGETNLGQFVDDEETRRAIADGYERAGLPRRNGVCASDDAAFKKLVSQWGFVLAPNAMFPARSTGFGGFHFSLQASYTRVENDASYWTLGTEGERDAASGAAPAFGSPPGLISLYSLNIRKNFGFGLEALANVGFVPDSNIINGGADIRISLLEGFRTGIGAALPDIAGGAAIRTITGTDQLQLTTVALDARISKPLPIADSSVITPWVGYQYLWIFGRSGLIDLTPGTDPLGYCGFVGREEPRQGAEADEPFDGEPVCAGGTSLDFNNNVVFDEADLERQRLLAGVGYRYELITAGLQFMTDLIDPASAQSSAADEEALSTCDEDGANCESTPRQWQLGIDVGVMF